MQDVITNGMKTVCPHKFKSGVTVAGFNGVKMPKLSAKDEVADINTRLETLSRDYKQTVATLTKRKITIETNERLRKYNIQAGDLIHFKDREQYSTIIIDMYAIVLPAEIDNPIMVQCLDNLGKVSDTVKPLQSILIDDISDIIVVLRNVSFEE